MKSEEHRTPLEIACDVAGVLLLFAFVTMPLWLRFVI
jgi:hypothetical protein